MRVVIDSNVWISALVFGGAPRKVFESAVRDGHTVVLSQEIVTEVRRILYAKFPDLAEDFDALLTVMAPRTELVQLGSVRVDACRDPDDNRVIETAVIGQAEYIVSGDKDLLALAEYKAIKIYTPARYQSM